MKIALLTWFHYHNYGTALQVAALTRALEKDGHCVDVVNYRPNGRVTSRTDTGTGFYLEKLKGAAEKFTYRTYRSEERERLFCTFYDEHLTFTKACRTYSDFRELNHGYDAFVCGSDQIWAPSCFDPRYFLDFVDDPGKLIAYAPSVGLPEIRSRGIQQEVGRLAGRFSRLSTREAGGSQMIAELTGRDVETVLDPTLLLSADEWKPYEKDVQPFGDRYLLAYFLRGNEAHWKKTYEIAGRLGLQVRIIPVFQKDLQRKGCIAQPAGPGEFLSWFRRAAFVCTDSFHGTVFAVNFHVPFFTFERFKASERNNQNSRIYHILSTLGLRSRLFCPGTYREEAACTMDFSRCDRALAEEREHSLRFLRSALESVKNHAPAPAAGNVGGQAGICCGCGACAAACPVHAVTLAERDGFLSAEADPGKCVGCGKCVNVCPFYGENKSPEIKAGQMYSYKDNSPDVLKRSSSGGAAHRIAQICLQDGHTAVGCTFDREQQRAKHIEVADEKDLGLLQGSKYLQSDFYAALERAKDHAGPIAVFGTPCQIAGARRLFADRDDILYVDLICHGVPSQLAYRKYARHLQTKYGMKTDRLQVSFRYKERGWRERYIYSADFAKEHCEHQSKDLFFRIFESGFCYAKSCYECRWRDSSQADVRLGDYWGDKFADDKTGVSMVIGMTPRGEDIVRRLREFGNVETQDIADYYRWQQSGNHPVPVFYREIIKDLRDSGPSIEDIVKKYVLPFERRRKISRLASKLRRIVKRHG